MTRTIPMPLVTWEAVVSTSDPTRRPTRAQIRTLRKNGLVSGGVRVQRRREGRAAGSHTYYSTLYALAIKAAQAGDARGAQVLRERGERIEERFAAHIRKYLADHALRTLDEAPFFEALASETEDALDEWSRDYRPDFIFATGHVELIIDEFAIIGAKRWGDDADPGVEIDLPRSLLDATDLGVGDYVWVFRRMLGTAAVLELLPAVPTGPDDSEQADPAEDERARGARYLESGAGARPTAAEIRFLRDREPGSVPRRLVRPVG